MMLTYFPQRTRRDLKLKFKKEERINAGLINKALLNYKEFDTDELERELAYEEEIFKKKQEELKKINDAKLIRKRRFVLI